MRLLTGAGARFPGADWLLLKNLRSYQAALHKIMNEDSIPYEEEERGRRPGASLGSVALILILGAAAAVLGAKVYEQRDLVVNAQSLINQANADAAHAQADMNAAVAASGKFQSQLEASKAEQADLRAKLERAASQQSDLQAQLGRLKSERTDLQTKLGLAEKQQSDLQSRLERSEAVSSETRGRLDQARAQVADLRDQLGRANEGTVDLRRQVDQARSQSGELQAQPQKTESDASVRQPRAEEALPMPIEPKLKKDFFGRQFTLSITSRASVPLSLDVAVSGPKGTRTQSVTVKGGRRGVEVRKLAKGDDVIISCKGYEPVGLVVK